MIYYFHCLSLALICLIHPAQGNRIIRDSIEVDGKKRIFILCIPESVGDHAPLVFALHGYGGSAEGMMEFSKMSEVAKEHGFVVCYPQGVFGSDNKNSWNAGYSNDDIDDVKFLTVLAKYVQSTFGCSDKNTFSTGMSNGADMSYVLACQASDVFSAIAPVAGCMMKTTITNCNPEKPVPVFEIHGTKDDITFWDGDPNYSDKYGGYVSVRETIDFWISNNLCVLENIDTLPNTNKEDKSFLVSERYRNHENKAEVLLLKIVGGEHDWPGSWGNMDVFAAEEIWKFFNQYIIE